uniref:Uncharacterized protein n=1 Tax=Ditylenchus dipsaci TaxID=166011 RepID=A0A915D682_9BILA
MQTSKNTDQIPKKVCNCRSLNKATFLHGTLLPTSSGEFPFVIYYRGRRSSRQTFLFPASLIFGEQQENIKQGKKEPKALNGGDKIGFTADSHGVVVDFERMLGFGNETCGVVDSSILIEDRAIFSPDTPQKCCSSLFGILPPSAAMMTVVPNIVYEVIIRARVSFQNSFEENGLPATSVIVNFQELVKPVANNLSNELIYKAPWNHDTRIICPFYDISSSSLEKDLKERPSLPKIRRHGVILYSLENNEVIWPKDPKYRVVIAHPIEHNGKVLKEGHAVQADMYYCKYNHLYVVYSDQFGGHIEYYVKLKRSSRLGFFVCREFDYCLVEDSKRLLMKAASDLRRKFFPAWLKRCDPLRLARFEVSALDHQHYNPTELWSAAPDVKSTGFLINRATGSVFAQNFPLERIILLRPDRKKFQVGDWFAFEAVFSAQSGVYMVLRLSPIVSKSAISAIPWRGGYLFEETVNCTGIRMSEKVYAAQNFGLVMDPENLIMDKAKKNRIELPQSISVFLKEDEDTSRSTAFKIYALSIDSKERETDDYSNTLTTDEKWWRSDLLSDCRCRLAKELSSELPAIQCDQSTEQE